jgi:hypothetical protein
LRSAIAELRILGYLGFDKRLKAVRERAEYLFSLQEKDGSWPLDRYASAAESEQKGYSMVPLQTALPLVALSACGYAEDHRAEPGYEWLLKQRLEDGAWPTGRASGVYGRVAGYRKMPHSRWGCRSNTTGALVAFAWHPVHARSEEIRRAADLLLAREKYEASNIGFEVSRGVGAEPYRGFFTYFARSDPGMLLELGRRVGFSVTERRIDALRRFILSERAASGLWHYRRKPQVSGWVSFFLIRTLMRGETGGVIVSDEPGTPFQEYPRAERRW